MRTYRKAVIIYNPAAGRLQGPRIARLDRAVSALRKAGYQVITAPTPGPGGAGKVARREIEAGADVILVAGGDGTVNEAISGMVGSQVPLGLLPAGTANVLATELGLGSSLYKAAERLATLVPKRISLGLLHATRSSGPRYFLLMAGIGVDAGIVHRLDLPFKEKFGKLAYWLGGFRQLVRRFEEFEVLAAGASVRSSFALASRVRKYGGSFEIARHVSLLDDHFEMVLFEGSSVVRYLRYYAGFLMRRLEGSKGVTFLDVTRAEFLPPPGVRVHVQVDGEYAGELPARVEIVPDALTLLVPPGYGQRR